MTTTATTLLHRAARFPDASSPAEPTTGACWLCGKAINQGIPARLVIKDTFMDHDKARCATATHFCVACAWSFSERVIMAGRDKPQRLRNYSHIVRGDEWHCLSKGQKSEMRRLLLDPPAGEWLAVIAESGQKHIIFRAPVAFGRERCAIQFEETRLTYVPADLRALIDATTALLTGGLSKSEIASGDYASYRLMRLGLDSFLPHETTIRPRRGSALFRLALFLAQGDPDERQSAGRPSSRRHPGPDTPPVDGLGRMGQEETEILGHLRECRDQRGADDQQFDALAQLRLL